MLRAQRNNWDAASQRAPSGKVKNIDFSDRAQASHSDPSDVRIKTRGAACLNLLFMADRFAGLGAADGTNALAETDGPALPHLGTCRVRLHGGCTETGAGRALPAGRSSRH
jgi:hypothetical protein